MRNKRYWIKGISKNAFYNSKDIKPEKYIPALPSKRLLDHTYQNTRVYHDNGLGNERLMFFSNIFDDYLLHIYEVDHVYTLNNESDGWKWILQPQIQAKTYQGEKQSWLLQDPENTIPNFDPEKKQYYVEQTFVYLVKPLVQKSDFKILSYERVSRKK